MITFNDVVREQDWSDYSDMYKSVHGIRPRWMYESFMRMTDEQIKAEFERLSKESEVEAEREAEREAEYHRNGLAKLEADIRDTINNGAGDRATALRWMLQNYHNDFGGMLYNYGVNEYSSDAGELKNELRVAMYANTYASLDVEVDC